MIYAVLGALVIGISLGLFGSGGSILTVPVLLYLLHHEAKAAIAESLGIVGAIALISALPYAKDRLVDWRTAVLFGLPGMAGTYLGAWLAGFTPGSVQLFTFAGVMLLASALMWRGRGAAPAPIGVGDGGAAPKRRHPGKILADGLGVGVLTGFVGVGGGFLIVPALVLMGGLSMRRAVATSLVVIAMKSAAGFWKYLEVLGGLDMSVDWGVIGLFAALGVVGGVGGKAIGGRFDQRALQRGFAVFLLVMAGFIVVKESSALLSPEQPEAPAGAAEPVRGLTTEGAAGADAQSTTAAEGGG